MSEARQCDACGKLYSLTDDSILTRPKHPVLDTRAFKIAVLDKYNRRIEEIDLCSDCMNRVFDILRGKEHGNDDEVRGEEARD